MKNKVNFTIAVGVTALSSVPAMAHPLSTSAASFAGGFAHPFSGWDHLLAMLALGLWLGVDGRARPSLAIATGAAALTAGFMLGIGGFHVPLVEPGILASVFVFGLLAATAARLPAAAAAPVVAMFMVFHGHAHGTEAPAGAAALYAAGFILASVAIVAVAYVMARLLRARRIAIVRALGAVIAASGVILGFAA